MATNCNAAGVFGPLLVFALAQSCGSSSSSSNRASTTQATALAIDLDGAAAIGTTAETGGLRLQVANANQTVVKLDKTGKVLDGNVLAVEGADLEIYQTLVIGDGSVWVGASAKNIVNADGSVTFVEVILPNGKKLDEDCHGSVRIKDGQVSCLMNGIPDPTRAKLDKLGNVMYGEGDIYRMNSEGVLTTMVTNTTDSLTTLHAVTDDGAAVVEYWSNRLVRLHALDGSSKSIAGSFKWQSGNYIATSDGLYTSKGLKIEITGWLAQDSLAMNATSDKIQVLTKGGTLTTIDLAAKTQTDEQLSSQVVAAVFTDSALYYASVDGVRKVSTVASLRLTAAPTETAVTGLDGIAIFSMAKAGDKVLLSGQNDSNSQYVTGAIEGTAATTNPVDLKVTGIQAL